MNLIGGVVGLVLVLLLAGPLLGLFTVVQPELSDGQRAVGAVAERALAGFLLVYVYGVVSSYLFTLSLRLVAFIPVPLLRRLLVWSLAAGYLTSLALFLGIVFPSALAAYLAAAAVGSLFVESGGVGLLWLLLHFALPFQFVFVLLAYILADAFAPPTGIGARAGTPASLAWRGAMVGVNAGFNFLLGTVVTAGVVDAFVGAGALVAGLSAGLVLGLLTFVGAPMPTPSGGANAALRALIGWTTWLLPTNWFTVSVGWVTYLLNALSHVLFSLPVHPWAGFFTIVRGTINASTGTMFLEGGVASNLWVTGGGPIAARGAYNLGSFANIHSATVPVPTLVPGLTGIGIAGSTTTAYTFQHESGHNLNLGAMGTFFHLVNLVDQNIFPRRLRRAYAERLADSNAVPPVRPANRSPIFFWRNA